MSDKCAKCGGLKEPSRANSYLCRACDSGQSKVLDLKLLTPREQHMYKSWRSEYGQDRDVRELLTTICELRRASTLRVPSLLTHTPEVIGVMQMGNGVDVVGVDAVTDVLLEKINNQRYVGALVHVVDRAGRVATLPNDAPRQCKYCGEAVTVKILPYLPPLVPL